MMTAAEIVAFLHRRGILLVPESDGGLRYRPSEALSEAERTVLARHRDEILALLDADPIGWRTAVMTTQVRLAGAMPLLLARPWARFRSGSCCSCGDPEPINRYCCALCAAATINALAASQVVGVFS